MDHDAATIELAKVCREAYGRAEQKIRSQQLGEAFKDLIIGKVKVPLTK